MSEWANFWNGPLNAPSARIGDCRVQANQKTKAGEDQPKTTFHSFYPIRRFLDPPERLIGKLSIDPDDTVVDFGCGPGYFLIPLAKVARRAIGVDVSPRMLEKASTKAKKKGVSIELLQNNGTGIRLEDNSADLIFLNHVFHEVDDKPTVLGEFHRILKPAGRLAIVERTHDSWRLLNNLRPPVVDEKKLIAKFNKQDLDLRKQSRTETHLL